MLLWDGREEEKKWRKEIEEKKRNDELCYDVDVRLNLGVVQVGKSSSIIRLIVGTISTESDWFRVILGTVLATWIEGGKQRDEIKFGQYQSVVIKFDHGLWVRFHLCSTRASCWSKMMTHWGTTKYNPVVSWVLNKTIPAMATIDVILFVSTCSSWLIRSPGWVLNVNNRTHSSSNDRVD